MKAVGIAHATDGNTAVARQLLGCAIAYGFPGLGIADEKHAGFGGDNGLQPVGPVRTRFAAIKRDAGAGQVVVNARPQKDSAGIGEAGFNAGKLRLQALEQLDLRRIERMIRLVGAGKMAHHQARRGGAALQMGERLGGRQAHPVHAGINVQRVGAGIGIAAPERGLFG